MVTNYNKNYRNILEIDDNTLAYIQAISLRKTFELLAKNKIEFNWDNTRMNWDDKINNVINKIVEINESGVENGEVVNLSGDGLNNSNMLVDEDGVEWFDCQ